MDFTLTEQQESIRVAIERICAQFGDDYWLEKDRSGDFPQELRQALARDGWLGICTPDAYGGSGLGVSEAVVMIQAIARSGAGMSGVSAVAGNIFGLNPIVIYGTEAQKKRMLPPMVRGEHSTCFAITEPNTGLDTTQLRTKAERHGDHYLLNGSKVFISTAQVANKMLILARTTPLDQVKKHTHGLSLFFTDFDRRFIDARVIDKMGRKAVDTNALFIDGLKVPADDLIGEEGRGFEYILHSMNPERMIIAAAAVGLGRVALKRATEYAKQRIVFGRQIGKNQGIQHPLAECWMELEAANLMVFKAASLYDRGLPCGAEANAAKYLAGEAGFKACHTAVMTHGGYGYAKEYHVERYLREVMIPRIAPISPQLVLCFIAEKVLGLPKSY